MRLALDIDDVLAGFVMGVHDAFGKRLSPHNQWNPRGDTGKLLLDFDRGMSYRQQYLDKCEHNKDFWYGLEAIALPVDVPEFAVAYITASPKNMVDVRIEWLKKHGFPTLPVIHSKDKEFTMKRLHIDWLVDDKLETVQQVRKHGLRATHFKPWYSTLMEDTSIFTLKDLNDV